MKQVQIDIDLFLDLYDYMRQQNDPVARDLSHKLSDKYERLLDHAYFTEYKRAPRGSEDRERFRKIYLDRVGVQRSFRSSSEVTEEEPEDESPDF